MKFKCLKLHEVNVVMLPAYVVYLREDCSCEIMHSKLVTSCSSVKNCAIGRPLLYVIKERLSFVLSPT